MILSASHVLTGLPLVSPFPLSSGITQPGPADLKWPTSNQFCNCNLFATDAVGILEEYEPVFPESPTGISNQMDAAVALCNVSSRTCSPTILNVGTPSIVLTGALPGLQVIKQGRSSLQHGAVIEVNRSFVFYTPNGTPYSYNNQTYFNTSAFDGDSGARFVTTGTCHSPVALFWGGGTEYLLSGQLAPVSFGSPLQPVINKMGELN
ncbi:MAG TPA: hypothetical protein VHS07_01765, partial [Candidatus Binataceae bacterium]|nr:hypothetical protein [Candidatus Binataceae bacterium]